MGSELIVAVVMEPFDRRVLDRAVPLPGNGLLANREREPFDLGATQENSPLDCFLIFAAPWVVGPGQPVLDAASQTQGAWNTSPDLGRGAGQCALVAGFCELLPENRTVTEAMI